MLNLIDVGDPVIGQVEILEGTLAFEPLYSSDEVVV
jgi:hypothetical protein